MDVYLVEVKLGPNEYDDIIIHPVWAIAKARVLYFKLALVHWIIVRAAFQPFNHVFKNMHEYLV